MTVIDDYRSNYRITQAENPQSRYRVYNIRYQVYCQEFGYEKIEDFPTQQETDDFDYYADHCLLTHQSTDIPVGCVRLVKSREYDNQQLLPFERDCLHAVDRRLFDPDSIPRGEIAEFSRLAVIRSFRVASGDARARAQPSRNLRGGGIERQSLFLAALNLLLKSDCRYGVAMMEVSLARMLRRAGILFEQIGEIIDFHGPRAPFMIRREDVLKNLGDEARELMVLVQQDMAPAEAVPATFVATVPRYKPQPQSARPRRLPWRYALRQSCA